MKSKLEFEDMKCIWMNSGVLNYKLCNLNFNCDQCALDKVLSNIQVHVNPNEVKFIEGYNDIIQKALFKLNNQNYSNSNIYLKNNLLLRNLYAKTYYLGFNPISEIILDNIQSIEVFDYQVINIDDTILRIKGDWGEIDIKSPAYMIPVANLHLEKNDSSLKNWFSLVEIQEDTLKSISLSEDEYLSKIQVVEDSLSRFKESWPYVGITMNDGGREVKFIYDIIGKKEYIKILKSLFA
jgi:hypothetical protein